LREKLEKSGRTGDGLENRYIKLGIWMADGMEDAEGSI
jgi:hypothetical protein